MQVGWSKIESVYSWCDIIWMAVSETKAPANRLETFGQTCTAGICSSLYCYIYCSSECYKGNYIYVLFKLLTMTCVCDHALTNSFMEYVFEIAYGTNCTYILLSQLQSLQSILTCFAWNQLYLVNRNLNFPLSWSNTIFLF